MLGWGIHVLRCMVRYYSDDGVPACVGIRMCGYVYLYVCVWGGGDIEGTSHLLIAVVT